MVTLTKDSSRINYAHAVNLFYLGYTILSQILRTTVLQIDSAQRINLILFLLVIIVNVIRSKGFWAKVGFLPIGAWIVWTIYATILKVHFGFNLSSAPMNIWIWVHLIMPCSILVIAYYECMCSPQRFIKLVTYCLALNLVLATVLGQSKFDEEGGLGNGESLKAFVFMVFICVAENYRIISKKFFYLGLILAIGITFWIATRKALAAEAIVIVAYFYSSRKLSLKTALLTILLLIIANYAYDYIMSNTFMGERIQEGAERDYSEWNPNNNWFLTLMQDRALYYTVGWDYFLKHPIFGIGIGNFPYYTGVIELPIHSEYMIQICECGIVGCVFYLAFMLSMLRNILKTPYLSGAFLVITAGYLAMLWLSFTAWIYDGVFFMMLYALIAGVCKYYIVDKKKRKSVKNNFVSTKAISTPKA